MRAGSRKAVEGLQPLLQARSRDLQDHKERPFSRWRCVFQPHQALARCGPFARLTVVVEQAASLLSADHNGLSDPFVVLLLNGTSVAQTKPVSRTLAPKWHRTFEVDISQPMSVLTVQVVDKDFGSTRLKDLDDLLGFVDLRLALLPLNEWVGGWFNLAHPVEFADTILGRMKLADQGIPAAGRIRLEFRLAVHDPLDELFAMCLPPPGLGHGYPPLDLDDLVATASRLSAEAEKVLGPVRKVKERLYDYITLVWLLLLVLLWNPAFLIPGLLVALGALAAAMGSLGAEADHTQDEVHSDSDEGLEEGRRASAPAARGAGRAVSLSGEGGRRQRLAGRFRGAGIAAVMAAGVQRPDPEEARAPREASEESRQTERALASADPEQKARELNRTVRLIQTLMPTSKHLTVRMGQSSVHSVSAALRSVHGLISTKGTKALLASVAGASVLVLLRDFQEVLLQIGLTLAVSALFIEHSAPGKFSLALFYYLLRRHRLQGAAAENVSSAPRALSDAQCRELLLTGGVSRAAPDLAKHALQPVRFGALMRCSTCGRLVARGVSKSPPLRCAACLQVVCRHCCTAVKDDCRGRAQEVRVHGSVKPTR